MSSRRQRRQHPGQSPYESAAPRSGDPFPPTSPPARANFLDQMRATHRAHIDVALAALGYPQPPNASDSPASRLTNAAKIVNLIADSGATLFRDPAGRPQIAFTVEDNSDATHEIDCAGETDDSSAHARDESPDAAHQPIYQTHTEKHTETHPLRSRAARNWIARRYHEAFGAVPTSQNLHEALNVLEGRAVHESSQLDVHLRLAEHAGAIYIDLGDDQWRAVEIDAAGWRVIAEPPVRFRRPPQLLPLPMPTNASTAEAAECRGENSVADDNHVAHDLSENDIANDHLANSNLTHPPRSSAPSAVNSISPPVPSGPCPLASHWSRDLRKFLNISDDHWPLVLGWLVAALRPRGPYPVLCLHGEQGSAKSTAALLLRSLVDPNAAPLRGEPKEVRDLMIAATHAHVLCFDNLSRLPDWLSNALCRLSTGGGFSTRTLYENDVETIFSASRPSILVGIDELATRGDLIDRAVLVTLSPIDPARRRPEEDLLAEFELARPAIFAGLCTALSTALANVSTTKLARLPRMADFARWATAAEPALGLEPGEFLQAYERNRAVAHELALEGHPLVAALEELLEVRDDGYFETSATGFLDALKQLTDPRHRRDAAWPKSPRALSSALRRLAPALRTVGIDVRFERVSGIERTRLISIRRQEP